MGVTDAQRISDNVVPTTGERQTVTEGFGHAITGEKDTNTF